MILVVVEHDRGTLAPATLEALTAGRSLAGAAGAELHAVTVGADADPLADTLGHYGASAVHQIHHDMLSDYGPEAWGEAIGQLLDTVDASHVLATGTDRGNEVLAQVAARRDLPMAVNVLEFLEEAPVEVRRVRWGGSLLEVAAIDAPVILATIAHHSVEATPADEGSAPSAARFTPELDPSLARSMVQGRVEREAGITLATAPVVVGGGRGVGSPEGFAPLEELAELLGGSVGCSRAVTNNGWRNHTDQVGQTGTRIAPDVYLACGISGAIQHWVGAMASKTIIAINTDAEANMVTKADYAVIADLHEMVPAISAEIHRRRA